MMRKINELYVLPCFEDIDGLYWIEGYKILEKLEDRVWDYVGWIDYKDIGDLDNLEKIEDQILEQLVEKGMSSKYDNLSDEDWIEAILNAD